MAAAPATPKQLERGQTAGGARELPAAAAETRKGLKAIQATGGRARDAACAGSGALPERLTTVTA